MIQQDDYGNILTGVSLSPDGRRVAVMGNPWGLTDAKGGARWPLIVFDLDNRSVAKVQDTVGTGDALAWSADGRFLYGRDSDPGKAAKTVVFNGRPPFARLESLANCPGGGELVANYLRSHGQPGLRRDRERARSESDMHVLELPAAQRCGPYVVDFWKYVLNRIVIRRDDAVVATLNSGYGLYDLGYPHIEGIAGLPGGEGFIVEGHGCLYVLDAERKRLGLLARGEGFVLRTELFHSTLDPHDPRGPPRTSEVGSR